MNNIKKRLYALYDMLGADLSDGSYDKAELTACLKGIEAVLDSFNTVAREIDLTTAQDCGLSLYSELTGTKGTLNSEEKRKLAQKRLAQVYGDYKRNDIHFALDELSSELTVHTDRFKLSFNLLRFENEFDIKTFADLINSMVPPCTRISFLGRGATFDKWDAQDYMFQELDNIELPFFLLEQMG